MADAPQEQLAARGAARFRPPDGIRRGVRVGIDALVGDPPAARFLTPAMLIALGLFLAVAASLASYSVDNNSAVYLDFLRRLLGLPADAATTSQFGSALVALPLFLVARALDGLGAETLNGAPLEEVALAATGVAATMLAAYIGWRLLKKLELPAGPAVIVLAIVGTPLFYYGALLPSYKHAADALFATLAALLLYRVVERPDSLRVVALGACIAMMLTIRTANAAMIPGLLLPLVLRRNLRATAVAAGAVAATLVCLYAAPAARGIVPHLNTPKVTLVGGGQIAAAGVVAVSDFGLCGDYTWELSLRQCLHNKLGIWPSGTAPLKMLFTPKRGLFLWTPLTALAAFGFVLLAHRRRDRGDYLLGLAVAALGLLLVHVLWGDFWDNGFSFSQRFLTSLFPVFLLGTAELVRRRQALALTALTVCALFSLGLAFTHSVGYRGIGREDGVGTMVELYTSGERTPQQLVRRVGVQARERWLGR